MASLGNPVAYPQLSAVQLARLRAYGAPQTVQAGEVLYGPGDASYDLILAEDATIEIVQPATRDEPEPHFLGWADDVDPDALFDSGQAWGLSVRLVAA